ncbi:MAG: integrase, partial [Moorella sp. (in: firmicutes)]|nr:integrase [Moorella sp. (in: firmicutes)]
MAGWVEKRGGNKWRLNVQGGTDAEGKRKVYRKTVEASSRREAEKLLLIVNRIDPLCANKIDPLGNKNNKLQVMRQRE